MHERHVAPRHRSPQSLRRTLGRFAGAVAPWRRSHLVAARTAAFVGVAGIAVGAGVLTASDAPATSTTADGGAASSPSSSGVRVGADQTVLAAHANSEIDRASRSSQRPALSTIQRLPKQAAWPVAKQDVGGAVSHSVAPASPQAIAESLLPSYGWSTSEFSCLNEIWTRESNWDPYAENASSGAYGIPQALPGSKMATAGSDWSTNPETQIKWGLSYIRASYGSPCGAWSFWESHSWY